MKIKYFLFLILISTTISFGSPINSDSSKSHRPSFTIVPYQFLLRSSAISLNYSFKKIGLDLFPSFTYATHVYFGFQANYDWFFYRGINSLIIISKTKGVKHKVGLILGYKFWWFNNQKIPVNYKPIFDDGSYKERKSSQISGPVLGGRFEKFVHKKYLRTFYVDLTATLFQGTLYRYEIYDCQQFPGGLEYTKPIKSKINLEDGLRINLGVGFKFGLKKSKEEIIFNY